MKVSSRSPLVILTLNMKFDEKPILPLAPHQIHEDAHHKAQSIQEKLSGKLPIKQDPHYQPH